MRWERVLVTGGAGYIGSQLIRSLQQVDGGPAVRVLDNMQRGGYAALMDLAPGSVEFVEGDILDPTVVRRALSGVDAIIHLAAIVSTPLSFEHPQWLEQVNHWGAARLVEAALEADVERFILASSYSVYGPGTVGTEEAVCRPVGPYASSKLSAEKAVEVAGTRGLSATVLRIGAVFGQAPVMRFEGLANRFAYLAGTGRTLTVYGDGQQTRPLTHVRDAASALLFALERADLTAEGTFNVLTRNASVLDVAEAARKGGDGVTVRKTDQDVRTHLSFHMTDERFRSLGWNPAESLEAGMAELIDRFDGLEGPRYRSAGTK